MTGPVDADVLLAEANWAIETYETLKSQSVMSQFETASSAHQQARLSATSNRDRKVHELLMAKPLPHLQLVYREVFENILGQKVSAAGPRLAEAAARLEVAKKTKRSILFVLHQGNGWHDPTPEMTEAMREVLKEFVIISMPLKEAPALSQLTQQPPYDSNNSRATTYVVARSNCEQIVSTSSSDLRIISHALAQGWLDALLKNPPNVGKLVQAQRLLRKLSPESVPIIRELTIQVQKAAKAQPRRQAALAAVGA